MKVINYISCCFEPITIRWLSHTEDVMTPLVLGHDPKEGTPLFLMTYRYLLDYNGSDSSNVTNRDGWVWSAIVFSSWSMVFIK